MNAIDIFPWDNNFNTGVVEIDEQHKKLVLLLNKLASQVAFKSDPLQLNEIFDELTAYTVYHFKTEEDIWHKYLPNDKLETEHIEIHKKFISDLLQLKNSQKNNSIEKVSEDVLSFLTRWLASHILETDRNMAYLIMALKSGLNLSDAKVKANEQMSGGTKVLIEIILSIYGSLSSNTLHLMRELAHKKSNEAELVQAKIHAESANIAKSSFLTNISHEIQTPLNGILGAAQLLQLANISHVERTECSKIVIESGEILSNLLNNIINLSNIERGQLKINYQNTDIKALIKEVCYQLQETIQNKGLVLEVNFDDIKSNIYNCDGIRIKHMLTNLLSNAIKFTSKGKIQVVVREIENDLEFSVMDTGIGISRENIRHLFLPFSQLDNSNSRRYQGAGIGLSTVKAFAELMGGTANVESELGLGSRFWFRVSTNLTPDPINQCF